MDAKTISRFGRMVTEVSRRVAIITSFRWVGTESHPSSSTTTGDGMIPQEATVPRAENRGAS